MADSTWATLTGAKSAAGSIARWVNNDSIDPEEIIAEAESWLEQLLRTRHMRTRLGLVLAEGTSVIDLATDVPDFLDPMELWVDGYGEILSIPEDDLNKRRMADSDGSLVEALPCYYMIIGETLYFDAQADQDYLLWLSYYAKVPALSASQQSNLYTEKYRSLFKLVAMGFAYIFLKDETRAMGLLKSAEILLARIEETDDLSRRGQVYYYEVA